MNDRTATSDTARPYETQCHNLAVPSWPTEAYFLCTTHDVVLITPIASSYNSDYSILKHTVKFHPNPFRID
jgi:hypothetical protein